MKAYFTKPSIEMLVIKEEDTIRTSPTGSEGSGNEGTETGGGQTPGI